MSGSILLCLATKKGHEVLAGLRDAFPDVAFRVTTFQEKNVVESHHEVIRETARAAGFPVHPWKEIRTGGAEHVPVGDGVRRLVPLWHQHVLPRLFGRVYAPHLCADCSARS